MKTRRILKKLLETTHGFLLLSALYNGILLLTAQDPGTTLLRSFLLFPVTGVFSLAAEKVRKFWQYVLCVVLTLALAVPAAGGGVTGIWMGVCVGSTAFSYFLARAGQKNCWLDVPEYPWLAVFFVFYLFGQHFSVPLLTKTASWYAGIYFLLCNLYKNQREVDSFVRTHEDLERFPTRRIGNINRWMMGAFSGLTAAAMIVAPYLGMDQLIRRMGTMLKALLHWLLQHIPKGRSPRMYETPKKQGQMAMPDGGHTAWLWEILSKILEIVTYVAGILVLLFFLYLILRKFYEWYLAFRKPLEENGDRIERLMAAPSGEKKKRLKKKPSGTLFWDMSYPARIRKIYKKRVLREVGAHPDPVWTPAQLESRLSLTEEERKTVHALYGKARYSNRECGKEEADAMRSYR